MTISTSFPRSWLSQSMYVLSTVLLQRTFVASVSFLLSEGGDH